MDKRIEKQLETLKSMKLPSFSYQIFDVSVCVDTILADFNIDGARHWYVMEYHANADKWSMHENLENGEINYIADFVSFRKLCNAIKRLFN